MRLIAPFRLGFHVFLFLAGMVFARVLWIVVTCSLSWQICIAREGLGWAPSVMELVRESVNITGVKTTTYRGELRSPFLTTEFPTVRFFKWRWYGRQSYSGWYDDVLAVDRSCRRVSRFQMGSDKEFFAFLARQKMRINSVEDAEKIRRLQLELLGDMLGMKLEWQSCRHEKGTGEWRISIARTAKSTQFYRVLIHPNGEIRSGSFVNEPLPVEKVEKN